MLGLCSSSLAPVVRGSAVGFALLVQHCASYASAFSSIVQESLDLLEHLQSTSVNLSAKTLEVVISNPVWLLYIARSRIASLIRRSRRGLEGGKNA